MRQWNGVWIVGLLALATHSEEARLRAGSLKGRVVSGLEGVRLADLQPVVVYLDGIAGGQSFPVPKERPVISQKDAKFAPAFLVVASGQTVEMANDDRIVHNVFSFSPPKRFDLGLYPSGETRKVTFEKPGVTELFCSIHSKMNATVFVSPSPYFSSVGTSGDFDIREIPPGAYRLRIWCRKLPEEERRIEIAEGGLLDVQAALGEGKR